MNKKILVIGLASFAASGTPLLAEEGATNTTAAQSAPVSDSFEAQRQARWEERNKRYQDLKQRAEKMGVMLPEKPPWETAGSRAMPPRHTEMEAMRKHHQEMMSMSPEEREAARAARYQEMREQAKQRGVEMPETPPWQQRQEMMEAEWSKHKAAIEGMSDEERAACHAMHRRHMGMNPGGGQPPMMRGPMGQGMGPAMGPGYGYGPAPYGQRNFWDPNQ
jgi:hypothetical protein